MRKKKLQLTSFFLFGLGLLGLEAQTIYVKENNEIQTTYSVSSIQKLAFANGNVIIQKTNNITGVYALSGLRYLNFVNLTTISSSQIDLKNADLITYPYLINDVLTIQLGGYLLEGTIRILNLDGKVVKEQKTEGANAVTVSMSQLPKGIYVCCYINQKEIKTVKIIKQ